MQRSTTAEDEPTETCEVFKFEIADNEEDREDAGNEDLERMYSFDLKEINKHKAEDANGLHFGWMPPEGSCASSDPSKAFAWNRHAAEFKPGQESRSLGQDGITKNRNFSGKGNEEKNESDKDVPMGLTPTSAEHAEKQIQDGIPRIRSFSENGIEKEIDLLNLLKHLLHSGTEEEKESDKEHAEKQIQEPQQDGIPRIRSFSENGIEKEIDLLNLLKHLLHSGTEEEKESDKDVPMGLTPTSAALTHAQQTRIACMARERSELEAKESLAQAQIAKLQQQLQELQFTYVAERSRSEQLESKVCELELAVRNEDLQLAEFQSAEKETMRPTGLGEEVNETAKERPHWDEQNGSNCSGYSPMTPRDSNNLKAKDVRADGPSDSDASTTMPNRWCRKRRERRKLEQVKNKLAESQEQCANAYAAAWKTAEEEQPKPSICTTASDGRSRDIESLNEASSRASDMETRSGTPDVASKTEATESSRFLQLIRLQDGSAENGSEFLPTELFPLLLDFLPVDEVVRFDVRAAWVFHLFKLVDIDSLPTWSSEKQMHPVVECFHKCAQAKIVDSRVRLAREHFLAEFVRIVTSDKALLSHCCDKVTDMADLVLADDFARLIAFRRHLCRAFLKPEMLSEVRHELLEDSWLVAAFRVHGDVAFLIRRGLKALPSKPEHWKLRCCICPFSSTVKVYRWQLE
eukprot:symbB.v1.2.032640.t1/scaffold3945.1/size47733/4